MQLFPVARHILAEVVRHHSIQGIYFLLFPSPQPLPPTKHAVAPDSVLRKGIAPGSPTTGARTNAGKRNRSKELAERGETWRARILKKCGSENRMVFVPKEKKRKEKRLFVSAPASIGCKRGEACHGLETHDCSNDSATESQLPPPNLNRH